VTRSKNGQTRAADAAPVPVAMEIPAEVDTRALERIRSEAGVIEQMLRVEEESARASAADTPPKTWDFDSFFAGNKIAAAGWRSFWDSLRGDQKNALRDLAQGIAAGKDELFWDAVNERALDLLEDSVLTFEDGHAALFEEYREPIAQEGKTKI